MERTGVRISWLSIRVFITRFNLHFLRLAGFRPKQVRRWFNVGCLLTIVSMPASFLLICVTFWRLASPLLHRLLQSDPPPETVGSTTGLVLQPVVSRLQLLHLLQLL